MDVPFYEKNLFWGLLSLGVAVMLTAAGLLLPSVQLAKWLFVFGWIVVALPIWLATKPIRSRRLALIVAVFAWVSVAAAESYVWNLRTRDLPKASEVQTPPSSAPTQTQLSRPHESQEAKPSAQKPSEMRDVASPSPELQLLDRAVEALRSCHSFLEASHKRRKEAYAKIQEHDAMPGTTDDSKKAFANWINDGVFKEDMKLYDQVHKPEFMEVRRLLAFKMPGAVDARVDYEAPGNMGGVLGICHDLSGMTERYISLEAAQGRITADQASRHLEALRRAQFPLPPRTR